LVNVVAAVALAAAGCTSDGDGRPPAQPTPPQLPSGSPATAGTARDAEQEALAAYRGVWDAYVTAIAVADPNHPSLARFAAGDALQVLTDGLEAVRRDGLAGRGDVTLDPVVTGRQPPSAPETVQVVDCVDTSSTELYRVDGEPFDDTPGGFRRAEATVRDTGDGDWKVTGFALYGVGSCDR
jgi:hypothetical protein